MGKGLYLLWRRRDTFLQGEGQRQRKEEGEVSFVTRHRSPETDGTDDARKPNGEYDHGAPGVLPSVPAAPAAAPAPATTVGRAQREVHGAAAAAVPQWSANFQPGAWNYK